MRELSLFSGAGGGLLASKYLLGWETVGYVEINEYCQKVIAQRIKDGWLDEAPIFGDIRAFNRDGYADSYQGLVDVVSGGFPCQDISCAGKGAGIEGSRSGLWSEMASVIRAVQPRYVFVENSPMLTSRGGTRVIGDLAEMGFDCRWGIISAADVGAPHLRKRIWIVANTHKQHDDRAGHGAGSICGEWRDTSGLQGRWWEPESRLGRMAHELAYRVVPIRATKQVEVGIARPGTHRYPASCNENQGSCPPA